jgi:poly-gamma-glutamate synthesis protein (capsule biosynthesis protein)
MSSPIDYVRHQARRAGRGCVVGAGFILAVASCASVPPPGEPDAAVPSRPVEELHIVAVGDIMLGGSAAPELAQIGYDRPFADVPELLQGAAVVFGNLEGPLTDGGRPVPDKQYLFRSPPRRVAPALKRAGFNIVSLANNHTLDYGVEGLEDTIRALDGAEIKYAGAGRNLTEARRPAILKTAGATVAVLAYSLTFPEEFWAEAGRPGTAFGHEAHVRADVAAARAQADIVIVSFHWGQEGKTELREYQTQLGRAAIEAGAAAVLGHHPHILQGVERYRHGAILYSLGNFVFGSYSNQAARSAVARLRFRDKQLTEVRLTPLNVLNAEVVFQPRRLPRPEADKVVGQLQRLSQTLDTHLENRDGVAVLTLETPEECDGV